MKLYVSNLSMLVGVGCLVMGAAQIHPAFAWAVGGMALVAFSLGLSPTKKKGS